MTVLVVNDMVKPTPAFDSFSGESAMVKPAPAFDSFSGESDRVKPALLTVLVVNQPW